jgi:hypothetical protein
MRLPSLRAQQTDGVKKFDTSGKSLAYHHRRKNFKARAGKLAAGFFVWPARANVPVRGVALCPRLRAAPGQRSFGRMERLCLIALNATTDGSYSKG